MTALKQLYHYLKNERTVKAAGAERAFSTFTALVLGGILWHAAFIYRTGIKVEKYPNVFDQVFTTFFELTVIMTAGAMFLDFLFYLSEQVEIQKGGRN